MARLAELLERQRAIQSRRNQALIGREFEVVVEGFQPRLGQAIGRTTSNRVINFPGEPDWVGLTRKVRVTAGGPNSLVGVEADPLARGPSGSQRLGESRLSDGRVCYPSPA